MTSLPEHDDHPGEPLFHLIEAPSREALAAHLFEDPALHLYALGDLEEPFYSQCRWWGCTARESTHRDKLSSVTLVFDDGLHGTLMAMATHEEHALLAQRHALKTLLEAGGTLDQPVLHAVLSQEIFDWIEQDPQMRERVRIAHATPLHRMMYSPQQESTTEDEALGGVDEIHLRALEATDEQRLRSFLSTHYPETFFNAETLAMGVTIGAWRSGAEEELVGVSGVHVFAPRSGVAALGHVVVRADHRGLGLGESVVGQSCRALRARGFAHIGLNVARANTVARRCYEKLGFEVTHLLVECDLIRR